MISEYNTTSHFLVTSSTRPGTPKFGNIKIENLRLDESEHTVSVCVHVEFNQNLFSGKNKYFLYDGMSKAFQNYI
jgi:hypothetical protein